MNFHDSWMIHECLFQVQRVFQQTFCHEGLAVGPCKMLGHSLRNARAMIPVAAGSQGKKPPGPVMFFLAST